jgi:hypothetical protein
MFLYTQMFIMCAIKIKLKLSFTSSRGYAGQTRLTIEFAQLLAHIDDTKLINLSAFRSSR